MINVVGGGIAGSIVARALRAAGHEALVVDDGDRRSGSRASSNLFYSGWLKKFECGEGLALLDELFHQHVERPFKSGIAAAMKVQHIPQRHLLVRPDVLGRVAEVSDLGIVVHNRSAKFNGPTVVCTGYRQTELLPDAQEVKVKVGHCFLFHGTLEPGKARLAIISPYRHEKLYQYDDDLIYYADSTATKMDRYFREAEHLQTETLERARRLVGGMWMKECRVGYRPFVDGYDFGYVRRMSERVMTVNGGGKNGIVAYAQAAHHVVKWAEEVDA